MSPIVQFFVERNHFDWFVTKKIWNIRKCGFEHATFDVGYMRHHQVRKRKKWFSPKIKLQLFCSSNLMY